MNAFCKLLNKIQILMISTTGFTTCEILEWIFRDNWGFCANVFISMKVETFSSCSAILGPAQITYLLAPENTCFQRVKLRLRWLPKSNSLLSKLNFKTLSSQPDSPKLLSCKLFPWKSPASQVLPSSHPSQALKSYEHPLLTFTFWDTSWSVKVILFQYNTDKNLSFS